jgi:hypothetical protein
MTDKVSCTCSFCLEKNSEGRLLSKRTKTKHDLKYTFQPKQNRIVTKKPMITKKRMITLKERRPKRSPINFVNFSTSIGQSKKENQYNSTVERNELSTDSLSSQEDNDMTTIEFEKQVLIILNYSILNK